MVIVFGLFCYCHSVIKLRATYQPKSQCQSDLLTVSVLANKSLHQDLMHSGYRGTAVPIVCLQAFSLFPLPTPLDQRPVHRLPKTKILSCRKLWRSLKLVSNPLEAMWKEGGANFCHTGHNGESCFSGTVWCSDIGNMKWEAKRFIIKSACPRCCVTSVVRLAQRSFSRPPRHLEDSRKSAEAIYWHGMREDVEMHVRRCVPCAEVNDPCKLPRAPPTKGRNIHRRAHTKMYLWPWVVAGGLQSFY